MVLITVPKPDLEDLLGTDDDDIWIAVAESKKDYTFARADVEQTALEIIQNVYARTLALVAGGYEMTGQGVDTMIRFHEPEDRVLCPESTCSAPLPADILLSSFGKVCLRTEYLGDAWPDNIDNILANAAPKIVGKMLPVIGTLVHAYSHRFFDPLLKDIQAKEQVTISRIG